MLKISLELKNGQQKSFSVLIDFWVFFFEIPDGKFIFTFNISC